MDVSSAKNFKTDFELIQEFQRNKKTHFIGQPRLKTTSHFAFFSYLAAHRVLVRQQEGGDLIGYAEFASFPRICALPRDCWMDWLKFHFCPNDALSEANVMFMNYFLFSPSHNPDLFLKILTEIFLREHKKRYMLIVELPQEVKTEDTPAEDYPNYEFLEGLSEVIYPRVFHHIHCKNTQRIHVLNRDDILGRVRYRLALAEDNDDLVEILDAERSDLRKEYGDFYIAETINRQKSENDDSCMFIVTEVNNKAMGFIWLNKNLDIWKLIDNYELEIFGNLIKCSPDVRSFEKIMHTTAIQQKPKADLFSNDAIQKLLDVYQEGHSTLSLFSSSKLNLHSIQGIISVSSIDERYFLQEELLHNMKRIKSTLRKSSYYTTKFGKAYFLRYNIAETYKGNEDEEGESPEPELNAFCLQLFGMLPSHDKRRLFRFVATSFSAYPDRDYCIIAIPRSTKITPYLSELLKHFVAVVPRPKCKLKDYLYITHRSSSFGDITVASVREQDVAEIEYCLTLGKNLKRRITRFAFGVFVKQEFESEIDLVKEAINEVLKNPYSSYNVLTIRCGNSSKPIDENSIVGFAVLRKFHDLHLLKNHFIIPKTDAYNNFVRSEVVILKLQPLYHSQSDVIFRLIGSHFDIYDFYYFLPNMFTHRRMTNDLVTKMQPIEPIHIKKNYEYIKATDADLNAADNLCTLDLVSDTFSVFNINLKPLLYFGNKNPIIILGFSNECRAFLRILLFNWNKLDSKTSHCCVPSVKIIVIVKPGEDEAEYDRDLRCSTCEDQNTCWINYSNFCEYLRDTVERMDLRVWVNFVHSRIDRINRKKSLVILENKCEFYYDTLLICNGTYFNITTDVSEADLPHNFAQVNSRFDKLVMYHQIRYIREEMTSVKIVVYGSHIRAFEFINFLLKHGIDAKWIALVIPFDLSERDMHLIYNIAYADLNIELILEQMVEDLGVKSYDRMNFVGWKCYSTDYCISHVMFESFPEKTPLTLECDLFVNYFECHKSDTDTFNLLKAAGIELNEGRILVDECFRTSEPNIFALGSIIQRRVEPNYQYRYVSSSETSKKVVQILGLNLETDKDIGARYRSPTYFQAQLPMGYKFVKITLPKPYLAHHLSNEYSTRLVTYKNYTFCRIRLNEHSIVEEFVCVTQQRIPFDFLMYFVGKHQALLNDLRSRWYLKEIDSFLDFFQEPWTELITHRKFNVLRAAIKDLCMETAHDVMSVNQDTDRTTRRNLMIRYMNDLGTTKEVEKTLLNYLRKYRTEFSPDQFALPEDFYKNLS